MHATAALTGDFRVLEFYTKDRQKMDEFLPNSRKLTAHLLWDAENKGLISGHTYI